MLFWILLAAVVGIALASTAIYAFFYAEFYAGLFVRSAFYASCVAGVLFGAAYFVGVSVLAGAGYGTTHETKVEETHGIVPFELVAGDHSVVFLLRNPEKVQYRLAEKNINVTEYASLPWEDVAVYEDVAPIEDGGTGYIDYVYKYSDLSWLAPWIEPERSRQPVIYNFHVPPGTYVQTYEEVQ